MRKYFVAFLVLTILLGTSTIVLADTRSTPKNEYVSVSVTNLSTGVTAYESLRAGTWYLYTHCDYGLANNLYPISAGADELYFNDTVVSGGATMNINPSSTVTATYEGGLPVKQTISYSRGVNTKHALYASKSNASTPFTSYTYGSTTAGMHSWAIAFTVVWNKK